MKSPRSLIVITLSTLLLYASPAMAADATTLVEGIKARIQAARTYTASMRLHIDVDFLNIPDAKAKIFFKAPNKTHIDAPGFAMIPREGADLSAAKLLSSPYTAVDAGTEIFHGQLMRKVKIIPVDDSSLIAVATIYIDTTLMIPRKVVTTSKQGGTYIAELVYDNADARAYCLPSYVKLIFDVGKFELPRAMTGDFEKKKRVKGAGDEGKAIVEIWYSDYRLNVPISDSIFK